jgi:uncharacterized protein YndB with AHSA1/START domain
MNVAVAEDTTLVMTRMFDARPEQVFDAWLKREEFQAWIGPPGVQCEVPLLEPRVGGRYRINMRMSTDRIVPVSGVYQVIDRPRTLVMTWAWDGDPARQSLLTLEFAERGGRTELTLRQEGLGSVANRDDHHRGWSGVFGKLATYLGGAGRTS